MLDTEVAVLIFFNYILDFRYWQTDEDVIYEESNGPTENLPLHRYIHSKYIWTRI